MRYFTKTISYHSHRAECSGDACLEGFIIAPELAGLADGSVVEPDYLGEILAHLAAEILTVDKYVETFLVTKPLLRDVQHGGRINLVTGIFVMLGTVPAICLVGITHDKSA